MKYIKKLVSESHSLAWTLAGTAMVLITLSGETKVKGLWISGIALGAHLFGVLVKKDENND